jgi:D-glycero-D-manno-heptose 1,7-bisphosphate phosphatase
LVQEAQATAYSAQDGMWGRVYRQPSGGVASALFLDRDGVIIDEVGYLHKAEDVRLIDGAADLIGNANARSIPIVVVTNQAGIGRGLYDWSAFETVTDRMDALLAEQGVVVDALYACPFHPEGRDPFAHPSHPARKPNPGMLIRAAAEMHLDLANSWLIGDKVGDIEAARSGGLAGAVHVLTGHGSEHRTAVQNLAGSEFQVGLADDLIDARQMIPILDLPRRGR